HQRRPPDLAGEGGFVTKVGRVGRVARPAGANPCTENTCARGHFAHRGLWAECRGRVRRRSPRTRPARGRPVTPTRYQGLRGGVTALHSILHRTPLPLLPAGEPGRRVLRRRGATLSEIRSNGEKVLCQAWQSTLAERRRERGGARIPRWR